MLVEIFNDKENKRFVLAVNIMAKAFSCKSIWIDEDLYDAETDNDFEYLYVEARLVKVSESVCIVESSVVEVVSDAEE